jgi:hypothetical protein
MSGSFAASLSFRRAPIAFGLCLLACLFAFEAKTAWYGPAAGFGSSVRAAKALPVATPKIVEHGVPTPDPAHPHLAFTTPPQILVPGLVRVRALAGSEILANQLPHLLAAGFSHSNLFRPPPFF